MPSLQQDTNNSITLADDVPVEMPELPARLTISTSQQFKAIGDPTRSRILGIIQLQPATAKQIADKLKIAPGTIGHHLQVLEAAGLAQVVARRLVHGIVAKYYTRTARIFVFDFPHEVGGNASFALDMLTSAREELAKTFEAEGDKEGTSCDLPFPQARYKTAFPHARMSPEHAEAYSKRIFDIIGEFSNEANDPNGQVYGLSIVMFIAPPYLQSTSTPLELTTPTEQE